MTPTTTPHRRTARQVADHYRHVLEEIARTRDWQLAQAALDDDERADVTRLCHQLAQSLDRLGFPRDAARVDSERWRTAMRLMLDVDGHEERQVTWLIDWCGRNAFWYRNIRSPSKLREQWDVLRDEAVAERQGRGRAHSTGRPASARSRTDGDVERLHELADQARRAEAGGVNTEVGRRR